MMRRFVVIAAVLLAQGALGCAISQTQAVLLNPQDHLQRAAYVLQAVVVAVAPLDDQAEELTLDVKRAFKGGSGEASRIKIKNFLGSDCSQYFQTGHEYLIFGYRIGEAQGAPDRLIGLEGKDIDSARQALRLN